MKYKTKYNIKVRIQPAFDAKQKEFNSLTKTLKEICIDEGNAMAAVKSNKIVNVKNITKENNIVFGELAKDAYICLTDGKRKFAVLLRENTNTKNK